MEPIQKRLAPNAISQYLGRCRKKMKLVLISIQALFGYTVREAKHMSENSVCSDILQSALIADIASHENDKDEIVKLVVEGKFKGKVYDE